LPDQADHVAWTRSGRAEESQEARGRLAPEAELITLDDAAHLINLDRPPRFAELVRTFIGSV
jgi:pimeloyl-ACP methyl ester carboxylesterase